LSFIPHGESSGGGSVHFLFFLNPSDVISRPVSADGINNV
jgi:hypothetical protein